MRREEAERHIQQLAEREAERREEERRLRQAEADRLEEIRQKREKDRWDKERTYRKAEERCKEKLTRLGSFKEGGDLTLFLQKFEYVMSDCNVDEELWVDFLYPTLPERLYGRIKLLMEDKGEYSVVKTTLLWNANFNC